MPEGPSILHYQSKLQQFKGKTVLEATGYGDMDKSSLHNVRLEDIGSFGKNFLFVFKDFFVTVHLGLFGRMLVDERKKVNASFALHFAEGEINFYVAKSRLYQGNPEDHFDFKTDVLKEEFEAEYVIKKLRKEHGAEQIGDAIMNQQVLPGVGNIIRVESLYRAGIHPQSMVSKIPLRKLRELLREILAYSWEFFGLMENGGVKRKALIYGKKNCPADQTDLRVEVMGKVKRKTYVCEKCQKLFV